MARQHDEGVVRCSRDAYGETFTADLLQQYKLYVHSAEHVSARRLASSRLLLGLNAGLAALYGIQPAGFGQSWWAAAVPILGIAVSLLWSRIIRSHKNLNRVKFKLIHELERHLPAAPYTCEWRLAEQGRGRSYRAVTDIERWLPWTFLVLHAVLLIELAVEAGAGLPVLPGR